MFNDPAVAAVTATAFAGLMAGAMSGLHCGAMCGGIAGAHAAMPAMLPVSIDAHSIGVARRVAAPATAIARSLAFNLGRIGSYTLAGAIAGTLGGATLVMQDSLVVRQLLFALTNLMLVALGLSIAGTWRGINVLERAGAPVWRRLQPAAAGLLSRSGGRLGNSVALGAVWGWIPCGLVYSMLVAAMAGGNAATGALVMLAFGVGTLPNLLLVGWAGTRLGAKLREPRVRLAAGMVIVAFGVIGLARVPGFSALESLAALCGIA